MPAKKKPEPKRPPYAGTRLRAFREGPLWDEAQEIAKSRGENLSAHVLRPALERYVKRHKPRE